MLEGVEKIEQQNEILRTAREFRSKLEANLLAECVKFEKETGLIIRELGVLRAAPNPSVQYRENESMLFGIEVNVGL